MELDNLQISATLAAVGKAQRATSRKVDALAGLVGLDPADVAAEARHLKQAARGIVAESDLETAKKRQAAARKRMGERLAEEAEEGFDSVPVYAQTAEKGERGDPGPKGEKGDPGPMPDHEWVNTRLRFKKPDGNWGKLTDLKGERGEKGEPGKDGGIIVIQRGGGSTGVDLSTLPGGETSIEPAGIPVMQGGRLVNLPWSAFLGVVAGALDTASDTARRDDFEGETLIYRGEAAPGTDEAAAAWKIRRIEFTPDGDVITTFAGGTADAVHVWADRTALEYS